MSFGWVDPIYVLGSAQPFSGSHKREKGYRVDINPDKIIGRLAAFYL